MMNFEGIQDLGGASAQNETQTPEEKVVNLEEQKKKRQPFAYWNVGGRSFKMKLKASGIGRLENKYRQNLMNMIDDIPPLSGLFYSLIWCSWQASPPLIRFVFEYRKSNPEELPMSV